MSFAINILALVLVLGLCWFAMMWLTGRSHGHGAADPFEELFDRDGAGEPCVVCEGVGATHSRGRVTPCPACQGTGVRSYS